MADERMPKYVILDCSKRCINSPTGLTPDGKRIKTDHKKLKWTPNSVRSVYNAEQKAINMGLQINSRAFWDFVAAEDGKKPRTGDACRQFVQRRRKLMNDSEFFLDSSTGVLNNIADVNEETPLTLKIDTLDNWTNVSNVIDTGLNKLTEDKYTQTELSTFLPNGHYVECKPLCDTIQNCSESARSMHTFYLSKSADESVDGLVNGLWQSERGMRAIIVKVITHITDAVAHVCEYPSKYCTDANSISSVLFNKDIEHLTSFDWKVIVDELITKQPVLSELLLRTCMPMSRLGSVSETENAVKRVCTTYAILMNNRCKDMSLLQRIIGSLLENQHAHQKIYDVLHPIGICLSHSGIMHLVNLFSGHFNKQLINNIKEGKRLRLVGDNVDVTFGVKYERLHKHVHMEHWFGSVAIFQQPLFADLPATRPQLDLMTTSNDLFMLTNEDLTRMKHNFILHIGKIGVKHLPCLKVFKRVIPKHILGTDSTKLATKADIVPLECLPYNETQYSESIKILESYDKLIRSSFSEADTEIPMGRIHIGGDQKTRERFSGSKNVLAGCVTDEERCTVLGPITFEMFHFKMKVLNVIYQILYKSDSDDAGTMEAEKVRLCKKNVDPDVNNHYDSDREFFSIFFESYVIESLMSFFKLADKNAQPEDNFGQDRSRSLSELSKEELENVFLETFERFVIFHNLQTPLYGKQQCQRESVEKRSCRLPSGTVKTFSVSVMKQVEDDYIYNYGRNVLELGLLFTELEDCCRLPDRARLLSIMKYLMIALRGHNKSAKYNLEVLRFLFHQLATLSEREAYETLYGLFINTHGQIDTHIPADLLMEHHVQTIKTTIKCLGSNKVNEMVIRKRTGAEPAFKEIFDNYCQTTATVTRTSTSKVPSNNEEFNILLRDIHTANPFGVFSEGRKFVKFPKIPLSVLNKCDMNSLNAWIKKNKSKYCTEIGQ